MYSISYEITALVARYILILLCVIVFVRTIFISRASRLLINNRTIKIASLLCLETNNEYNLGYDTIIGCSNRCDIRISGRGVAKIHIQIYKKKDKWMLCTYAKRATFLNEIKIGGRVEINSRDVIKLGTKRFRFMLPNGEIL